MVGFAWGASILYPNMTREPNVFFSQWTMNNEGEDKVLKTVQAVNKTIKHLMDMVSNFEEKIAVNSPQQQRKRNGLKQYLSQENMSKF